MKQFLVYDMGGTYIKFALMNENFEILSQDRVPSPKDSVAHLLEIMKGIADRYQGQYEAAAVSMPGRVDTAAGITYVTGAYAFMSGQPFGKPLSEMIGCKTVLQNDGKCAAKAEAVKGALKDTKNGAVMVLGTGTGGGIVLNHEVWMGLTGGAGELSFLPFISHSIAKEGYIWDKNEYMFCGYGSATGLMRLYAAKKGVPVKQASEIFSGKVFFDAYDAGEPEAIETLEEFGVNVAVGINAVQCVLELERYAIGGGISARKEITDSIRRGLDKLSEISEPLPFSKPEVVSCQFRNDANLIGALSFLMDAE